jgi:pimeloyl-ACP methyl ester carboxylesterase
VSAQDEWSSAALLIAVPRRIWASGLFAAGGVSGYAAFFEISVTGNAVTLRYAAVKRFRDDGLVSEHLYFDQSEGGGRASLVIFRVATGRQEANMPRVRADGVDLYYEASGEGEPLVLVHGGWGDHTSWRFVVADLALSHRVVAYDRRGHSDSDRSLPTDVIRAHEDDLGALIEELGIAPAHVGGTSLGGALALRLGSRRPELVRSICAHEPPSFEVLRDDPKTEPLYEDHVTKLRSVEERLAADDMEGGARLFFETIAFGPGAWEQLPEHSRRTFVANAPTFLAEMRDPEQMRIDLDALARLPHPTLLTNGDSSNPEFPAVVARLAQVIPKAERKTLVGAGHVPHVTHPADYVRVTLEFLTGLGQRS